MKICLIFPNYVIRETFGNPSDPPLGIALIAAVLEKMGYEVTIIDANAENLKISDIRGRLRKIKPDVAAISCNYSPLHNPTLEIAAMIKDELDIPVVVGGNHATALAEYIIGLGNNIDYVARGEGETVLPDLLEALQGRKDLADVKGLTYRKAGSIVSNDDAALISNLDTIPLPAYHLLKMELYNRYNIIASRGCPYNCSYCASNVIFKRRVRYRSPEHVVDEIELLLSNYGNKRFWFSDDTFTSNTLYVDKLLDEIIHRNIHINWSCLTRVNSVSGGILNRMKKTGCTYISYGVESGNPEMLKRMNKRISLSDVENALKLTKDAGIEMYLFFLVGNFNETWDSISDSYRLIIDMKPTGASFAVVIPLPGTKMFNDLTNKNLIDINAIQWDYLFAKIPGGSYEDYAAGLASRWCSLESNDLIRACKIGETLPLILNFCEIPSDLRDEDIDGISKLYTPQVSSHIKDRNVFIDSVKMYLSLVKANQ